MHGGLFFTVGLSQQLRLLEVSFLAKSCNFHLVFYVGTKEFQPKGEVFKQIQEVGQEYGATTGRKRQVNWMNLNFLKKAAAINGITHLVFNKVDVLENIEQAALYHNGILKRFDTVEDMCNVLTEHMYLATLNSSNSYVEEIFFSRTPYKI